MSWLMASEGEINTLEAIALKQLVCMLSMHARIYSYHKHHRKYHIFIWGVLLL